MYQDGWEKAEEEAARRAAETESPDEFEDFRIESARQKRIDAINQLGGGYVDCPHCGQTMMAKAVSENGGDCLYCGGHITGDCGR